MKCTIRARIVGCLLALLLATACAIAQPSSAERILKYHSDITVNADATMRVRETITVQVNNEQIEHGIYRDFPTRYRDKRRKLYLVGFDVVSVWRDGKPEPYHLAKRSNGVRIYIGDKNTYVSPGKHTYTLTYTTDNQLGFFPDHDELFWNVTGNGWVFPIDQASASVTLPQAIPAKQIRVEGYTGPKDSKARNLKATVETNGKATFVTTRPLGKEEGLSIVVSFPKGFVKQPSSQQVFSHWNRAFLPLYIALLAVGVLVGYNLLFWAKVGKDPETGVIIPLFTPPDGLSPAALRYLSRMGYDVKAFTAAVINLAVKGYVRIEEHKQYTISRVDREQETGNPLAAEEKVVLEKLLTARPDIVMSDTNYVTIQRATDGVKHTLDQQFGGGRFFRKNTGVFIGGIALALVLAALVAWAVQLPYTTELFTLDVDVEGDVAALPIVGTVFALVGGFLSFGPGLPAWKKLLTPGAPDKLAAAPNACCLSVFGLPFLLFGLVAIAVYSLTYSLFLLATLIVISIFGRLIPAYTPQGRKIMDAIEGFRMYLETAEKDEMNFRNPPERTPELFERYLPYALALDVEQQWAEQFADVLARAGVEKDYHPAWYTGSSWSTIGAAGFASSMGTSFAGAISSSSTAPGSSSGSGGGGSSGGGGGGGGGGGW